LEGGHRGGCLNGRLELARRDTPRVDEARRTLIDQQNLTAYLAFQRVFIEPQRPVSSFIVLDQPSQAFFPRGARSHRGSQPVCRAAHPPAHHQPDRESTSGDTHAA
jgi:hypothetical protein